MGFYKLGTQARVSCKHPYKAEPDPPISICKLDGNKAIWSFSSCGLINSPVPEIKYDSNAINIPKGDQTIENYTPQLFNLFFFKEGCGDFPNISFAVVVNYTQAKNRETDLFPIGTNVKVKCIGSFKNEESVACQPDGTWKNARCNDENGQHRLAGPAIGNVPNSVHLNASTY